MCFRDDALNNTQIIFLVGPRIELAINLVDRFKALFLPDISFTDKETVCDLIESNIHLEAYPSHGGLPSARGYERPSVIMLDEADFHSVNDAEEVRAIAEGYISKSNPFIFLISTPNAPEGLMEDILREPEQTCLYKRFVMPYTVGLGKIFSESEIADVKGSPSFSREMMCEFLGQEGNIFDHEAIQAAIRNDTILKDQIHPTIRNEDFITPGAPKSMGIDGAFGGDSKFAITVCEDIPANGDIHPSLIQVKFSEEYVRPDFDEIIARIVDMRNRWNISKIYVDAANPEVVRALKRVIGERTDYENLIAKLKVTRKLHIGDDLIKYLKKWMDIIPVAFNSEGRSALARTKIMLDREWLAIDDRKYHKLIVALRTAVGSDSFLLDKQSTSHDDLLDSFRLSLLYWDI